MRAVIVCLTTAVAAAGCIDEEPMQNLTIPPELYANQRWFGQFRNNEGGIGFATQQEVVRVQLTAPYTRVWAVNMGPVTSWEGGNIDNGMPAPFLQSNAKLRVTWGSVGFNEEVVLSYPAQGGTFYLTAAYLNVWGSDDTTEPLRPAQYTVWVQEGYPTAQGGPARWPNPYLHQMAAAVPPINGQATFFRPRRAMAFSVLTANAVAVANQPVAQYNVTQLWSGTRLDSYTLGPAVGFPVGSKDIIPLHPVCDRIVVTNEDAGDEANVTVLWYLDLG